PRLSRRGRRMEGAVAPGYGHGDVDRRGRRGEAASDREVVHGPPFLQPDEGGVFRIPVIPARRIPAVWPGAPQQPPRRASPGQFLSRDVGAVHRHAAGHGPPAR
ncbi:hypothetical protein THAOC_31024, partial [Thalassiosira oceanica]